MVRYRKSTERKLRGDGAVYVCHFYLQAVLRSGLRIMTPTRRLVHLRHCGDVTQVCYRDRAQTFEELIYFSAHPSLNSLYKF